MDVSDQGQEILLELGNLSDADLTIMAACRAASWDEKIFGVSKAAAKNQPLVPTETAVRPAP